MEPDRCPTCTSNDPRVRQHPHPCQDPWHIANMPPSDYVNPTAPYERVMLFLDGWAAHAPNDLIEVIANWRTGDQRAELRRSDILDCFTVLNAFNSLVEQQAVTITEAHEQVERHRQTAAAASFRSVALSRLLRESARRTMRHNELLMDAAAEVDKRDELLAGPGRVLRLILDEVEPFFAGEDDDQPMPTGDYTIVEQVLRTMDAKRLRVLASAGHILTTLAMIVATGQEAGQRFQFGTCQWNTGGDPASGCDEPAIGENGLCGKHAEALAALESSSIDED